MQDASAFSHESHARWPRSISRLHHGRLRETATAVLIVQKESMKMIWRDSQDSLMMLKLQYSLADSLKLTAAGDLGRSIGNHGFDIGSISNKAWAVWISHRTVNRTSHQAFISRHLTVHMITVFRWGTLRLIFISIAILRCKTGPKIVDSSKTCLCIAKSWPIQSYGCIIWTISPTCCGCLLSDSQSTVVIASPSCSSHPSAQIYARKMDMKLSCSLKWREFSSLKKSSENHDQGKQWCRNYRSRNDLHCGWRSRSRCARSGCWYSLENVSKVRKVLIHSLKIRLKCRKLGFLNQWHWQEMLSLP